MEHNPIKVGGKTITNSKWEKLSGMEIDKKLDFNEHVQSLCRKASQK